ncbi:MAG: HAMP domain-containing histidine kinase [Actinomycetota bacterium]|nr:HAMP domain-containing histidine kinase [Actinomycetota bacterium]
MASVSAALRWPARWWARRSLRARLTLLATALFSIAVLTGAILVLTLQRYALLKVLDSSAQKTASDVAEQIRARPSRRTVVPTTGGVTEVQVVDANDMVIAASFESDRHTPLISRKDLASAREGQRFDITSPTTGVGLRVLAQKERSRTVLVVTDLSRVDDSIRVLTRAALIGGPLAVLLMGLATYFVVELTLRPVAALRHGAADITAAGLADQRLPVPGAQDEINRLAVTLNAMLDRIDAATARQRTFVGDAAHELRSPLASLRVQLEVTQRIGPDGDWPSFIDEVLVDVGRLDRLVGDLLALARMDEAPRMARRHEQVRLDELVETVAGGYRTARVPVRVAPLSETTLDGDEDAMRRVVVNLVDNAIRYAATEVSLNIADGARAITLTVTDDGPGIPPAERERVFDRFYRLEASRSRESGGSGLGLPIVRELVRAHGGTIRLGARPDGKAGLHAVVTLPAEAHV